MTQSQQFDADVASVERDALVIFEFEGREYTCQRTPIVDKLGMVEAGFELSFDFTIEVRVSQFPAGIKPPVNTNIITIDRVEYRIVQTTPDQFGVVNHYALKQVS